jgi:hypothetical protein
MDFIQQLEEVICLYTGNVLHNVGNRIEGARLRDAYKRFFDGYPLRQKEQRFHLAGELRRLYSLSEPSGVCHYREM